MFKMAKMIVMYEEPKDKEGFENHYFSVHIPIAEKLPNIIGSSIHRVVNTRNSDLNLYLIAELEFENLDVLQEALGSQAGKELTNDTKNLLPFLEKPPIVTFTQ